MAAKKNQQVAVVFDPIRKEIDQIREHSASLVFDYEES